ncbi:MAG: hypothetical protein AB7F43_07650 [Bacteriovoracia bacterium]
MKAKKLKDSVLYQIVIYVLVVAAIRILYVCDHEGFVVGEAYLTQAARNFFVHFDYTNVLDSHGLRFGPHLSSGLAVTWVSGLFAKLHLSLFTQRVAVSCWVFLQFLVLVVLFFRRLKLKPIDCLLGASFAWLLLLRAPYWPGFIFSSGELPTAIWMGLGLYLVTQKSVTSQMLGFFFFGLGTWSGPFLYTPLAFTWIGAYKLSSFFIQKNKLAVVKKLWIGFFIFLLPLLFWLIIISLRYDFSTAASWFTHYIDPFKHLLTTPRSTNLEWTKIGVLSKAKILIAVYGSILLAILSYFKTGIFRSTEGAIYLVMTCTILLLYGFWYFWFSPTMAIRDIQPAYYIGFGFTIYLFSQLFLKRLSFIVSGLVLAIICIETINIKDSIPIVSPTRTYARSCFGDFTAEPCLPAHHIVK